MFGVCLSCGKQVAPLPSRFTAVLAFDCDGTLDVGGGPVPLSLVKSLSSMGLAVYIVSSSRACANCGLPVYAPYDRVSTLMDLKRVVEADRYIYVGDLPGDAEAARQAGWEFIYAKDFTRWVSTF